VKLRKCRGPGNSELKGAITRGGQFGTARGVSGSVQVKIRQKMGPNILGPPPLMKLAIAKPIRPIFPNNCMNGFDIKAF